MEIAQHKTRINGLEIAYYCAGSSGSPVILLHGGGTDSALLSWREVLPYLAEGHQVYAPDWPGYGESWRDEQASRMDGMIACLEGLVETWGFQKAHWVGLSMGGGAAMGFALTHPERVERLVLVDPYGIQKRPPGYLSTWFYHRMRFLVHGSWESMRSDKGMVRAILRRLFADEAAVSEALVEEVFEVIQDPTCEKAFYDFQQHEMTVRGLRTFYTPRLHQLQPATLFIHGDHQPSMPIERLKAAAAAMPDSKLSIMEGCGSWPPREHPQEFSRLVLQFIEEREAS